MDLIFKDRRFWPLFWTQFLGALNDNFFKNALVMIVTFKSIQMFGMDSKLLVPMAGGIFILPFFLASATAGQIADKYQKATIIRYTKITELLIMCVAAASLIMNSFAVLMILLFLMGAQSAFFGPLKYGIIPQLIKPDELVTGNAFVTTGTFIAILVGTIAGGFAVGLEQYTYWIAGGLVFLSLIGIFTSKFIQDVKIHEPDIKVDYTFFKPTWDIIKMTFERKVIINTILGISWFWFLGAAILSLLPNLVKSVLGGNQEVATLFLATFTIGMGLGSFFSERLSGKKVEIGMVAIASLGMTVFLGDLYFVCEGWPALGESHIPYSMSGYFAQSGSIRAIADLLMISIFGGAYIVPQMTYIQQNADPGVLSRTIAGNNIWNAIFMVSAAIMLMLLAPLGIGKQFLILAGLNLIASFMIYKFHSLSTVRFWCWIISKVLYKIEVKGEENIPDDKPFIVCTNHVSFVDWVIVYGAVKRPVQFIIDWNYYYMPMGPFWFKQAKLIPIATKKESEEVLEKAFNDISTHIKDGAILGLFPEGWITRDGEMRKFQPGILKVLKRDPVSVVICGIDGLWGSIWSWERGKLIFKFPQGFRRKLTVTFSEPIEPEDFSLKKAEDTMRGFVGHYADEAPTEE